MPTPVYMEALSPTMEEGRLVKWHKREGDAVKSGETLAEVETDKAVMELVARADGVLGRIAAREGETVPVGTEIAVIAAPGDTLPPPATSRSEMRDAGSAKAAVKDAHPASPTPADATRVKASPLARRMAKEAGVDLKLVPGSGPGGRVVKKDVESVGRTAVAMTVPQSQPIAAVGGLRPADRPTARPPEGRGGGSGPAYEDVPLTQIRKTIAKRLATSLGPIPHYFLTAEVDMERAAEARAALNATLGDEDKVSFNDVILKATALALRQHRACNAWFQEDHIRYWNEVHLGMAVAVEDGLITPVVRHADLKTLSEISREARELALKARARRLQPAEYTGSTFSISNLGMFDIDQFTAVINPPEAGILAVGSVVAKPVVVGDQVTTRRRMRITMSCDHRVIDGATGAEFLRTLKQMLENPLAMLL